MPILTATRSFEGSDSSSNPFGRIIKEGVRVVSFRDEKNKDGNFFFILPPYKLDRAGNGVSWKVINVRLDFGIDTKERFVEAPDCPIKYFSNQVKMLFPGYAKVEEETRNNKKFKKYPTYGRVQKQTVFNVAYFKEPHLGAYVLHVPQFQTGQAIEEWSRKKDVNGNERPLLNDHRAAYPVWFQLKKDVSGNPWVVNVENSKAYQLPEALADSDNLYNLDEVLYVSEKEGLIEKLRSITPADIFNTCMEGYFKTQMLNGSIAVSEVPSGVSQLTAVPTAVVELSAPPTLAPVFGGPSKVQTLAPNIQIPKATIPGSPMQQAEAVPQSAVANSTNPIAMSREQAKAFITKKVD